MGISAAISQFERGLSIWRCVGRRFRSHFLGQPFLLPRISLCSILHLSSLLLLPLVVSVLIGNSEGASG
jgi:hypothetical protein